MKPIPPRRSCTEPDGIGNIDVSRPPPDAGNRHSPRSRGGGKANSPSSGLSLGGEGVPEGDVPGGEKERKAQEKERGGEIRGDAGSVAYLHPFPDIGRYDDGRAAEPRCPAPGTGGKACLFGRPEEQGGKNDHPRAKEQDGHEGAHPA